jgi:hypothetical protein
MALVSLISFALEVVRTYGIYYDIAKFRCH